MKKVLVLGILAALLFCGLSTTVKANNVASKATVVAQEKTDWNKVIDEYEKCINDFIVAYKKVQKGDVGAQTECMNLAEKMKEYAQKLATAKGELTDAQSKRIVDLLGKLSTAMTDE